MKRTVYKSYDELPLMMSVPEVAAVLGISRAGTYELVKSDNCQRRFEIVRKRRRNFVIFRRRGG